VHILIVEDEAEIREVLAAYFVREGWKVDMTSNGIEAFQKYDYEKHDLVILDLKLEGMPGERVCQLIREKSKVPIIMLTSKSMEADVIKGLEMGADDYVVKPFRVKELVARIKAIMRRSVVDEPDTQRIRSYNQGALLINLEGAEVILEGKRVNLTTTEFKLLSVLSSQPLKVVSRADLLYNALGSRYQEDGRSLDVHIKNLRKKIEPDTKRPQYIQTVIGMGYRFGYPEDGDQKS
jgi:DNA-binding response OmpR family regulator